MFDVDEEEEVTLLKVLLAIILIPILIFVIILVIPIDWILRKVFKE
tara:strand:+ start:8282 stop:8419 length:138 start_codon:yes stop_codon:yes gene_type:complete